MFLTTNKLYMAQFKNKFKTSHKWFFMESTNIWNILNHRKAFQLFLKVISFPSTAYVYTLSFFPTDTYMYVCMYVYSGICKILFFIKSFMRLEACKSYAAKSHQTPKYYNIPHKTKTFTWKKFYHVIFGTILW